LGSTVTSADLSQVAFTLKRAFGRSNKTKERSLGQFTWVHLMNWKHTIFFENVLAGFIELAFNLGFTVRISTLTKWRFSIPATGLRNVPEDWRC